VPQPGIYLNKFFDQLTLLSADENNRFFFSLNEVSVSKRPVSGPVHGELGGYLH
jgi:hypothetical protein